MFYTVASKESETTEEIAAKQLLASRPILVELFEYQNDVTMESRVECRIEKLEPFPRPMQLMIIDYFEVGHGRCIGKEQAVILLLLTRLVNSSRRHAID